MVDCLLEVSLSCRDDPEGDAGFGKSHGCAFGSAEVRDRLDDLLGLDAGAILCRTLRDTLLRRDYYNRNI